MTHIRPEDGITVTDDTLYVLTDEGDITVLPVDAGVQGPAGPNIEVYTYGMSGQVTELEGKSRIYVDATYEILAVRAAVGTAPTGAGITLDVNVDGVSVWETGHELVIAEGEHTAMQEPTEITEIEQGSYLTVDILSAGTVVRGSDLTVTIRLRRWAD